MSDLEDLGAEVTVTEERKAMLDLMKKRLAVDNSIVLHRDGASAADLKAMFAHMERAGMPLTATLKVDGADKHTRMYARWAEKTSEPEALNA